MEREKRDASGVDSCGHGQGRISAESGRSLQTPTEIFSTSSAETVSVERSTQFRLAVSGAKFQPLYVFHLIRQFNLLKSVILSTVSFHR